MPRIKPPRKRRKITKQPAPVDEDEDDELTIVVRPLDSDNDEDDSMQIDPTPPAAQLPNPDNVSTDIGTPAVPKVRSVLEDAALIAEIRLMIYDHVINLESRGLGLRVDHHGRFCCPIDATGLPPYFYHGLTKVSGLRQEYLVEVFRRVVFVFTSSASMKLFSEFVCSHFNLDPAQVPRLHVKAEIFHNDSFPQGNSLNLWRPTNFAHGQLEGAHSHVRAWVAQIMGISTALHVELHFCRPWRNFRYLKGSTLPLRLSAINMVVTYDEFNWTEIPMVGGLRHFLCDMMVRSVNGMELDLESSEIQANMSQGLADSLVLCGTRGFRG